MCVPYSVYCRNWCFSVFSIDCFSMIEFVSVHCGSLCNSDSVFTLLLLGLRQLGA